MVPVHAARPQRGASVRLPVLHPVAVAPKRDHPGRGCGDHRSDRLRAGGRRCLGVANVRRSRGASPVPPHVADLRDRGGRRAPPVVPGGLAVAVGDSRPDGPRPAGHRRVPAPARDCCPAVRRAGRARPPAPQGIPRVVKVADPGDQRARGARRWLHSGRDRDLAGGQRGFDRRVDERGRPGLRRQ